MTWVEAPLIGTVVWLAPPGTVVAAGETVAIIEAMKMEHVVAASDAGTVAEAALATGERVEQGQRLVLLESVSSAVAPAATDDSTPTDRADLAEVRERHDIGRDAARPDAVAKRRERGRRTARENLADLVDPGSFVEIGPLAIAAQRRRRDIDDLIAKTPADGLVGGIGTVNADLFGPDGTDCVVASYDYMVLAGTQGMVNHRKKDRLFELAERRSLPVVFLTEGGGGRPGDVDMPGVSWLDCLAFALFGGLSGSVPLIGINAGYCFAGNAALLGTCDVVIATEDSNIGMAGPAMISGGGLGDVAATAIGPTEVHRYNGVIDIVVPDEAAGVAAAKTLLGFHQGAFTTWEPPTTDVRSVVPVNRKQVYDMHNAILAVVDEGSGLELRADIAPGMITTFARIEGRPVGIIANNPLHLSGAVDHAAAEKAVWFMRLCDSWGVPLLFLCDTPGFMVGPPSDAEGLPRSAGEMFRVGGNLSVPFATVITRKGYGLGAQAMAGGGFKEPLFTVSWPTGEFGPMGLEGAVELGFAKELAAAEDEVERKALFETLVEKMYHHGKAVNVASHFEIDDVIDPADTRRWVTRLLR
ncbi:MAG: biotin carboxylase [Acidimicrobiales bacterium]|nr:MAG: biotin carboxylase [Acidimicrobiales bacterium]